MKGRDVVDVVRPWIGTPYVHQASVLGMGADCLGLLRGVWRELYRCEPEDVPRYSADWSEPQRDEVLLRACARHMIEKPMDHDDLGDVLLFRMRSGSVAKHLGIQTSVGSDASFVHAYSGHGVVETSLSEPWRRRLVARFSFPNVQERGA